MAFPLKTGDLLPRIRSTLTDASGNAIDLTGAAVVFEMKAPGATELLIQAPATVIDPINGIVEYAWRQGDTDTPGAFIAEWDITSSSNQQQTVPNNAFVDVLITKSLEYQSGTPVPVPPLPPSVTFVTQTFNIFTPKPTDGTSIQGTGIAANAPSNVMSGPFQTPDIPRSAAVKAGAGWDGGNLLVSGLDQFGNAQQELIVVVPGGVAQGNQVWSQVTGASKTNVGASSAVATLGLGQALGIGNAALGFPHLANTQGSVECDGLSDAATLSIVFNSFVPETAPDGSHSYTVFANVL